jgi:hypothetical protein
MNMSQHASLNAGQRMAMPEWVTANYPSFRMPERISIKEFASNDGFAGLMQRAYRVGSGELIRDQRYLVRNGNYTYPTAGSDLSEELNCCEAAISKYCPDHNISLSCDATFSGATLLIIGPDADGAQLRTILKRYPQLARIIILEIDADTVMRCDQVCKTAYPDPRQPAPKVDAYMVDITRWDPQNEQGSVDLAIDRHVFDPDHFTWEARESANRLFAKVVKPNGLHFSDYGGTHFDTTELRKYFPRNEPPYFGKIGDFWIQQTSCS